MAKLVRTDKDHGGLARILNLPDAVDPQEPATLGQVQELAGGAPPVNYLLGNHFDGRYITAADPSDGVAAWSLVVCAQLLPFGIPVGSDDQILLGSDNDFFAIDTEAGGGGHIDYIANCRVTDGSGGSLSSGDAYAPGRALPHNRYALWILSRTVDGTDLAKIMEIDGQKFRASSAVSTAAPPTPSSTWRLFSMRRMRTMGYALKLGAEITDAERTQVLDQWMANGYVSQVGSIFSHAWGLQGGAPSTTIADSIGSVDLTIEGSGCVFGTDTSPRW